MHGDNTRTLETAYGYEETAANTQFHLFALAALRSGFRRILEKKYFSIKLLIKSLFPITFKEYWFMTTYIVLYIFTPYLNKLINSMTKKENTIFLNVGILLFSII